MKIQEVGRGSNGEEETNDYTFHFLNAEPVATASSSKTALDKWGFGEDMSFMTFRYEERASTARDMERVVESLFRSTTASKYLPHVLRGFSCPEPAKAVVQYEKLTTEETNMQFFDRLREAGAISDTGHIRGRLDEYIDDIPISDLVREALLLEESELYDTFTPADRQELLFRVFKHLVIGGASNQYEDHVERYFDVTRGLYRDLLTVERSPDGRIEVKTACFSVLQVRGASLFAKEHQANFLYAFVDPTVRQVRLWHFAHRPIW